MGKYQIDAVPANCAGCLRCELACSDTYTRSFNPSAARIRVVMSGEDCRIDFTEECIECGMCADHCFYGALSKTEKGGDEQ